MAAEDPVPERAEDELDEEVDVGRVGDLAVGVRERRVMTSLGLGRDAFAT